MTDQDFEKPALTRVSQKIRDVYDRYDHENPDDELPWWLLAGADVLFDMHDEYAVRCDRPDGTFYVEPGSREWCEKTLLTLPEFNPEDVKATIVRRFVTDYEPWDPRQ